MKIALLTTDTTHHLFFAKELNKYCKVNAIAIEESSFQPQFETKHQFEAKRDKYEIDTLLENDDSFENICSTNRFNNINDKECFSYISKIEPDIIIVFGTGLVRKRLINLCPDGIINLHGGDPQQYRGLDSHLWAIYHKEFEQLITTLHRLNNKLDDGEIINQLPINISRNFDIKKLRAENTKVCLKLVLTAIKDYQKKGQFNSYLQKQKGRYYSFMPSCLKEICVKNLQEHVRRL